MKPAKQPSISCPRCEGKGKLPLSDVHWAALQLVREAKKVNAEQLRVMRLNRGHIHEGQSRTHTNNLLEDLRRFGFVTRSEKLIDRKFAYTPVKTSGK